jgi:ketosteroid isomerase-like protein
MVSKRDIVVLVCLGLLAAATALLQSYHRPPLAPHDQALRQTIGQQINAFQRRDKAAAWALATPQLQKRFSNPDVFMAMVDGHYEAIAKAHKFNFEAIAKRADSGGDMRVQKVFLTDQRGKGFFATYLMQKQPDGSWKIAGCQLLKSTALDI